MTDRDPIPPLDLTAAARMRDDCAQAEDDGSLFERFSVVWPPELAD